MQSSIAKYLALKYEPVAIQLTNEKPEKARQFKEGKFACVMFMLGAVARGGTAVFDRNTFGCFGGGVGLGFGNQYRNFPGGEEGFCYFLSVGNEQWEEGRQVAEQLKPFMSAELHDDFVRGERYLKSPEAVRRFVQILPITDVPFEYVVFKPLANVPDTDQPEVVVLLGDLDLLAALVVLANYDAPTNENVIIPFAAGCQSIALYPFREAASPNPRAVVGLMDISARVALKRQLKDDLVSFAVPFALFRRMEANAPESFLQ
jgi:uncharacterized protein (DUF169 family)